MSNMRPARPNLADEIVGTLRAEIARGVLLPGTRLLELPLASRFGTSQTPVREALRLLERDGLVRHVRRRGVFVREFTMTDVDEIYSLRATLEGLAASRMALTADAGEIVTLRETLDRMRKAGVDDPGSHVQLALKFHEGIARFARHQRLLDAWRSIMAQTVLYAELHTAHISDFEGDVETHAAILEAIDSGDPVRAEDEARRHVAAAHEDFVRRAVDAGLISPRRQGTTPFHAR